MCRSDPVEFVGNGDGTASRTGGSWSEDDIDVAQVTRDHSPAIVGLGEIRSAQHYADNSVGFGGALVDVGF